MYILERYTSKHFSDPLGIVGFHNANITTLDEWETPTGIETLEITEEEYNDLINRTNIKGLTKPRYKYDDTQGIIDN